MAKLISSESVAENTSYSVGRYVLTGLSVSSVWVGTVYGMQLTGVSLEVAGYVAHVFACTTAVLTLSFMHIPRALLVPLGVTISTWPLTQLILESYFVTYIAAAAIYFGLFCVYALISRFRGGSTAIILTILLSICVLAIFLR